VRLTLLLPPSARSAKTAEREAVEARSTTRAAQKTRVTKMRRNFLEPFSFLS
jgi:hypothetical protein